jgi:hypothetical protein
MLQPDAYMMAMLTKKIASDQRMGIFTILLSKNKFLCG